MELNGDDRFANVEWFSGSFHLLINSLQNLNGKHSKDIFSFFWSQWRKTSPRLARVCQNADEGQMAGQSHAPPHSQGTDVSRQKTVII